VIENCDTINLNLDSRLACEARPGSQIRNPKLEIRNKFEIQKAAENSKPSGCSAGTCFGFETFEFRICFGFRASDFGFRALDARRKRRG
jgi:hypothetical protein